VLDIRNRTDVLDTLASGARIVVLAGREVVIFAVHSVGRAVMAVAAGSV
jgi:hypothetical protein